MIKKDFRYIIKRVIIGICICLGLSFINSCNVKAVDYGELIATQTRIGYYGATRKLFYNYDENIFYFYDSHANQYYSFDYNDYYEEYPYVTMSKNSTGILISNNPLFLRSDNFLQVPDGSKIYNPTVNYMGTGLNLNQNNNTSNWYWASGYSSSTFLYNYDIYNYKNVKVNNSNYEFNLPSTISTIADLGVQRNFDDNNILASVTFNPTFNNFDTSKFTYQYRIGSNNWLTITSNDVTFNVNQNNSVYFRISKNSDNSVVDSRIYTITQIGVYENNTSEYKVVYNSENRSVDSSSSSPSRTIDRVTINFEYFPKISNLKYQYQYVEEDSSLSDWIDMPVNDYERGYTTVNNGTMYNRILDENNNVLYTSTFNVNSIGKLMIDDNISWYSSLLKKIDYGSGIGSIFFLPVRLIESIQSNFGQSCQSYNLGSLLGVDLIIPCIDIKSHIGATLYNTIDLIFMGFIVLSIIKFIISLYNRVVSLNFEGTDDGSGVLFL